MIETRGTSTYRDKTKKLNKCGFVEMLTGLSSSERDIFGIRNNASYTYRELFVQNIIRNIFDNMAEGRGTLH